MRIPTGITAAPSGPPRGLLRRLGARVRWLLPAPVVLVAACAEHPVADPHNELLSAYAAMRSALALHGDIADPIAWKAARDTYDKAYQLANTDPDRCVRLAQESAAEAGLAQAHALRNEAERRRKQAEADVHTLEQMAKPGTTRKPGR